MKSMTGFGQGQVKSKKTEFSVSIRSVNGRYLEPRFHLPREFYSLESELRKVLNQFFARGTVDIYIAKKSLQSGEQYNLHYQDKLADQYVKVAKKLIKDFKLKGELQVETLMKMPDVLKVDETAEVNPEDKKNLLLAFKKACENCITERIREGKSLKNEIKSMLTMLRNIVGQIAEIRVSANEQIQARIEKKLKEKSLEINIDPNRIAQEVVMQIDRADINEELSRLNEHFMQFEKITDSADTEGKKLDFYTQELLREVNTIGSKSQVAQLTQLVVQAKTLIEKIREQVQNVE